MKIKGLLPNRLYSIWQFNQAACDRSGGTPSIFITDTNGNATLKLTASFTMDKIVDNLLIAYHSDHRVYDGTPSLLRPRGGPELHLQLIFNVKGVQ